MSVKYPGNQKVIDRMREEITHAFAKNTWEDITGGCPPTGDMDDRELSRAIQPMVERLETVGGPASIRAVFQNVRHALTRADYQWARDLFLQTQDIDAFAEAVWQMQINQLEECVRQDKPFFDQPMNKEAVAYARSVTNLFFGRREGNQIVAVAIPYRLVRFLRAQDETQKRYYACHCQFARESILGEKQVSSALCHCSMGHTKLFWEAALDTELKGDVLHSALHGDTECRFVFALPDDTIKMYVKA